MSERRWLLDVEIQKEDVKEADELMETVARAPCEEEEMRTQAHLERGTAGSKRWVTELIFWDRGQETLWTRHHDRLPRNRRRIPKSTDNQVWLKVGTRM